MERIKRRSLISKFLRGQQNTVSPSKYRPWATGWARLHYIIPLLTPRSSRWSLSCRSSPPKPCTYLYPPPLTCHMPHQYHLPLFVHPLASRPTYYENSHL